MIGWRLKGPRVMVSSTCSSTREFSLGAERFIMTLNQEYTWGTHDGFPGTCGRTHTVEFTEFYFYGNLKPIPDFLHISLRIILQMISITNLLSQKNSSQTMDQLHKFICLQSARNSFIQSCTEAQTKCRFKGPFFIALLSKPKTSLQSLYIYIYKQQEKIIIKKIKKYTEQQSPLQSLPERVRIQKTYRWPTPTQPAHPAWPY